MKKLFINTILLTGIKPLHKVVIYWTTINFCLMLTVVDAPLWFYIIQLVNLVVCSRYIKNNVKEPEWMKELEYD